MPFQMCVAQISSLPGRKAWLKQSMVPVAGVPGHCKGCDGAAAKHSGQLSLRGGCYRRAWHSLPKQASCQAKEERLLLTLFLVDQVWFVSIN